MGVWKAGQAIATGLFLFWLAFSGEAWASKGVTMRQVKIGRVHAYVVIADLKSKQVSIGLSVADRPLNNGAFPHEPFKSIVNRSLPAAAINGTYYDTRNYRPVGILAADGRLIAAGTKGTAVCFDSNNRVRFYKLRDWHNFPLQGYNVVLSTGPTLVDGGRVDLFPRPEGFHDPALFRNAKRSALGITRSGKLLLVSVTTPVTLKRMALVMKKLGAYRAVNLDGGASTGLYYRGRYLAHPTRLLTNVITVYERPAQQQKKEAVGLRE